MLRDLTLKWFRVVKKKDTNSSKDLTSKTLHPLWRQARAKFLGFARTYRRRRVRHAVTNPPSVDSEKKTLLGYVAKIAAREDRELWSFDDLVGLVLSVCESIVGSFGKLEELRLEQKAKLESKALANLSAYFDNQRIPLGSVFG